MSLQKVRLLTCLKNFVKSLGCQRDTEIFVPDDNRFYSCNLDPSSSAWLLDKSRIVKSGSSGAAAASIYVVSSIFAFSSSRVHLCHAEATFSYMILLLPPCHWDGKPHGWTQTLQPSAQAGSARCTIYVEPILSTGHQFCTRNITHMPSLWVLS